MALVSAALRGPDHTDYDHIATEAVSDHAAIALSIGRFPKGYPALDPNEDGALVAVDTDRTLLVVVDGHHGFNAAGAALTAVAAHREPTLDPTIAPATAVSDLIEHAFAAVTTAVATASPDRTSSRTTLAVALLSRERATLAGIGDSRLTLIHGTRVRSFASTPFFLGPDADLTHVKTSTARLAPGDVVVLGSDGLFDFLGSEWKATLRQAAAEPDPTRIAEFLVRQAFAGGAGDNVAVAVARR